MTETSNIKKGDVIIEIATNKKLRVDGIWIIASDVIDFTAKYLNTTLMSVDGFAVYANRGFKFSDEGIVWKKHKFNA